MKRGENWFLEIWKIFSLEIFFGDLEKISRKKNLIERVHVFPVKIYQLWSMFILKFVSNLLNSSNNWFYLILVAPLTLQEPRCLQLLLNLQFHVSWEEAWVASSYSS